MKSDYLFIYGTLLSALNHPMHDVLKRYAELSAEVTLQAKLFDLGRYPGVVLSDNQKNRVKGEIYKISDCGKLFKVLDRYEGCSDEFPEPHQYLRRVVPVQADDDTKIDAWVYLFNWNSTGHRHIDLGDYKKYVQGT